MNFDQIVLADHWNEDSFIDILVFIVNKKSR